MGKLAHMSRNVSSNRVPVFSLGERITKARRDLGLSQQQFAELLGVDRKTVSNWEGERVHVRYGDLMLIASTTDVSLEWLAGDLFRPTIAAVAVGRDGANNRQGSGFNTHRDVPQALAA